METFGPYLVFFVPTAFIICVIFLIIAIFQDAKVVGKTESIKGAFFSIMSFLSLLVASGSVIFLTFVGLRAAVFQDAHFGNYYASEPPGLTYSTEKLEEKQPRCVADMDSCPLSENQKNDIANWLQNYRQWQHQQSQSLQNRRDLINGFSILAVSLPLFVVFLWLSRQDARKRKEKSALEPVYSYALTFMGMALIVIAGAVLINALLKSSLLPRDVETSRFGIAPLTETRDDVKNAENLSFCAEKCELSTEYTTAATEWKMNYEEFQKKQNTYNPYHGKYASSIPMIIVGALLATLHFPRKLREKKKK